jgi:ribonucleoside-triphosphate reductase
MADEWKLPRPKAITLGKPEGTGSKTLGGTDVGEIAEGINRPLGRFILNWINFSVNDPLVTLLESAGYRSLPNPSDVNNVLVCFPVEYDNIKFFAIDGKEVNLEPAVAQLNRYLRWNNLWADHNMSCTISYSPNEITEIVDWIDTNWDRGFIAVSFLKRNDPTKTARDLGHPYLPQEVVMEGPFREYQQSLREIDWSRVSGIYEIGDEACATGACPVK